MILLPVLPATVTLDVRACALREALPRIGGAFGVAMRATPAIEEEIAIFSLRGADLAGFRARIASAFAAEWSVGADGTLTLNRSARLRGAEERAYFARREAGAASLVAALARQAAEAAPITPALVERYRAHPPATNSENFPSPEEEPGPIPPERRLLAEVVAGLRPADLAAWNERVVFSSAPTARQRPFPLAVAPLVARFERERALMATLGEDASPEPGGPVRTLHLVVESDPTAMAVQMNGYDAAGRIVAESGEEVAFLGRDDGPIKRESRSAAVAVAGGSVATAEPAAPVEPGSHVFPASAETKAFTAALGEGFLFSRTKPEGAERQLARPFLDVVARDPLSHALTDAAFEAGRITGRSVIVRPDDFGIFAGAVVGSGKAVPIPTALGVRTVDLTTSGWLVARSDLPHLASLAFFPRPSLREALGLAFADGAVRIGTATRIATLAPETGVESPMGALPQWLAFGRAFLYLPALRILAAMGEDGRRRAAEGVRFGDLPPGVRARLERLVFGPSALAIRLTAPLPGRANLAGAEGLESEPTSLLPDGIPADARVTVTTVEADSVIAVESDLQSGRTTTPEQLAAFAFQRDHPKLFDPGTRQNAERWRAARLRRAGREITTLRVDLTPRHCLSSAYTAYEAASGPEFTMASLPPDLRAAVERAMAGVEARYRGAPEYVPDALGDAPPP